MKLCTCKDIKAVAYLICNVITYVVQLKKKKIFSVQSIARTITKGSSTDLERLRAIWIWLCNNIGQLLSHSFSQQYLSELSLQI